MFEDYLARWQLISDGDPIVTASSRLLPVRRNGAPAMLKVAIEAEEKFGGLLMAWWDGNGAAEVLEQYGDAILIERAEGAMSLAAMARNGRDEEATRIICSVIAKLHAPRAAPLPDLIPLSRWFGELELAAGTHGGLLSLSADTASALLADPREVGVLHGDVHHGNILDFGERGWLAIDPKRLTGERSFDYANLFCNPDAADPTQPVGTILGRFRQRLKTVTEVSGIDRRRLLQWILAWCGLSAAWLISDGGSPSTALRIAELAAAELAR
jgi:streptomycin 6-kinase